MDRKKSMHKRCQPINSHFYETQNPSDGLENEIENRCDMEPGDAEEPRVKAVPQVLRAGRNAFRDAGRAEIKIADRRVGGGLQALREVLEWRRKVVQDVVPVQVDGRTRRDVGRHRAAAGQGVGAGDGKSGQRQRTSDKEEY